jgi:hypothetical protein
VTSLWARYALPRLTDLAMRGSAQDKERARFVPLAAGTVLEVGAGSGLEMKRILKAEGRLIFVEHGRAPEPGVRAWQDRINPIWKRVAGGCHLTRKIDDLLVEAGFRLIDIDREYSEGPRIFGFLYKGVAGTERP